MGELGQWIWEELAGGVIMIKTVYKNLKELIEIEEKLKCLSKVFIQN